MAVTKEAMMKAAIYLRVSTEEQARPGHVSLQAQRETCLVYCQREGSYGRIGSRHATGVSAHPILDVPSAGELR